MKIVGVLFAIFVALAAISCSGSPDLAGEDSKGSKFDTQADQSLVGSDASYLEKKAKDIGVKIGEDGHLLVEGRAEVQFLRLLTYFNAEAKSTKAVNGSSYKISGFYGAGTGEEGYTDAVIYSIQISADDFSIPADLLELARASGLKLMNGGYLLAEHDRPHDALSAILLYRNAEAANSGRQYKLKAWYETKELSGTLLSDRVDVVAQFSFDEKFYSPSSELATYARNLSAVELRQKSMIAVAAVDFSQLLEKPGELTITSLDFSGDTEQGPTLVYLFEGEDIRILNEIRDGKLNWDTIEILSLAETKEPRGRYAVAGALVDQPDLPESEVQRTDEPIGPKSVEILVRIAVETARVINPTSIEIMVHEFAGDAPVNLTTWTYTFDKEDVEALRGESMPAEEALRLASIVERILVIPGGRTVPPFKPIIK